MNLVDKAKSLLIPNGFGARFTHSAVTAILCAMTLAGFAQADDPIPTNKWTDFYGSASYNGGSAPVGSIVEAFDPDGVLCGRFYVHTAGLYGFLPVYGDYEGTPGVDEGAEQGDAIVFHVNGLLATLGGPGTNTWLTGPVEPKEVGIAVTGGVTGIQLVSLPSDQFASPGDTVEFTVVFQNTGNVTDFYKWDIESSNGWEILAEGGFFYVPAGSGDYSASFKVVVPNTATLPDDISFDITSGLNNANNINGTVRILILTTDVGDDDDPVLPREFALGQNYPNPFNPSTKIPFALSKTANVTLSVYDITGRRIDQRNLGTLSVGNHEITYDATGMATGVYFYKVKAGEFSAVRRMLLIK